MKKSNYTLIVTFMVMLLFSSCKDQDDLHDIWLENGEINYVGKVDSLKTFGGNERIKFQAYLSDSRARYLNVSWNVLGVDKEARITIPDHERGEPFTFLIGAEEGIEENEYTFTFVSENENGVKSIPFKTIGKVYGSKYRESLSNRLVTGFELVEEGIYLEFSSALNSDDQGIELTYNNGSEDILLAFSPAELEDRIFLETPDFDTPISYVTVYRPNNSLDVFKTEKIIPSIEKQENIALGKPTTSTPTLTADYTSDKAVDGIKYSNSSRWINHRVAGTHWIEIDFQGTFPIEKVRVYDDTPIANFTLEVEVDGQWQVLENATDTSDDQLFESIYSGDVSASKIRYVFETLPENDSEIIRMFEFEVFSTVKIQ